MMLKKGFTIIELLIAIFVLGVGIIGVLQVFPIGTHIAKSSQMTTVAVQLAQAKIEGKILESYDDIQISTVTEDYGEITGFNSYKRVIKVSCVHSSDLSEVACDYDSGNDPYPMKKIEAIVSWRSPLGSLEKEIKIATLTTKK